LKASIPAGQWHLVGDGIITESVDVHFEVLQRRAGTPDVVIVSWDHHFDPLGGGVFDAQPFDADADGPAVMQQDGDQLIFRYTGASATRPMAYEPNGDGGKRNGRNPNITLPARIP
jgi:hypothetical protein